MYGPLAKGYPFKEVLD